MVSEMDRESSEDTDVTSYASLHEHDVSQRPYSVFWEEGAVTPSVLCLQHTPLGPELHLEHASKNRADINGEG